MIYLLFSVLPGHGAVTIEGLFNGFKDVSYLQGQDNLKNLKTLEKKTRHFLKNKKKAFLKSGVGVSLRRKQKKLVNYLALIDMFDRCVVNKESKRKLHTRIIDGAGISKIININCDDPLKQLYGLDTEIQSFIEISNTLSRKNLLDNLLVQSQKNSVKSYVNVLYRYTDKKLDGKKITNQLCKNRSWTKKRKACNKQQREKIKKMVLASIQEVLKSKIKRVKKKKIITDLNKQIHQMNVALEGAGKKIKVKKGHINWPWWDSSDPDFDEKANSAFKEYQKTYMMAAAIPPGQLLMTDSLRESVGRLRAKKDDDDDDNLIEESDSDANSTQYMFMPHRKIKSEKQITRAIDDAKSAIVEQISQLNAMAAFPIEQPNLSNTRTTKRDLRRLLKTNPSAAGNILINHPELAPFACTAINAIDRETKKDEKWDKHMEQFLMVGGGALLATGAGSLIGSFMLGAASASSATLATLAVASAGAGFALSGVEVAYFGHALAQKRQEREDFNRSFLAGGGDLQTIQDARDALEKFEEARFNVLLAGTLAPLDLIGLKTALLVSKGLSAEAKVRKLNTATKFLDALGRNKKVQALFKDLVRLLGNERAIAWAGRLSSLKYPALVKTLRNLLKWGKTIEKGQLTAFLDGLAKMSEKSRVFLLQQVIKVKPTSESLAKAVVEIMNRQIARDGIKPGDIEISVNALKSQGLNLDLKDGKVIVTDNNVKTENFFDQNGNLKNERIGVSTEEKTFFLKGPKYKELIDLYAGPGGMTENMSTTALALIRRNVLASAKRNNISLSEGKIMAKTTEQFSRRFGKCSKK